MSILIFHKVIFGVEQRGVLMFRRAPSCRKKRGSERDRGRERERKKKKVCVLARVLGARVHYGGVSVSRRALFPHPPAPGLLHNIKKHKQSILNVTQRKSKRERLREGERERGEKRNKRNNARVFQALHNTVRYCH